MYPNYYHYYGDYRQTEKLVRDVEKAINGEYSAIRCYEKLANIATSQREKKQIQEIRKDEQKHFNQFVQLYSSLTGRQPQPKITEECPRTYVRGLEFAFWDEQNTVDFYHEIADETNNPYIKDLFRRAAADEQNHAVWFMYFLFKQRHSRI